jgi:hypothetical protein
MPMPLFVIRLIYWIKSFLIRCGFFISKTTPVEEVGKLIGLMKPKTTQVPLVRIGSQLDGGYLIPDDLKDLDACFSPGVSTNSDFEFQLAETGIRCFMADFSVDGPAKNHPMFHFEKKFLGAVNDSVFMTLENWVKRNAPGHGDLLLQMDIESAEYEVLLETPAEILNRFRIIVVEFHDLETVWSRDAFRLIYPVFHKLSQLFEIVHIHPNNIMGAKSISVDGLEVPSVLEISFLRKDRITKKLPTKEFRHPLDQNNSDEFPDYPLPRSWYSSI